MYEITREVGASSLGANGVIRLGAIVDFMQDCSGFQLETLDGLQKYFKEKNIGMYLASRQLNIHRLPLYRDVLTIKTGVYECRTIYGFRNTMIYDAKGELCVSSYAVGPFIDLLTTRPIKMPKEVIDTINFVEKADMEYLPRKITIPENISPEPKEPFTVMGYNIDVYNHVNNARYLDFAAEYIDPKTVKGIRLDYRTAAKNGDKVKPMIYKEQEKMTVVLQNDDIIYAVVEFTF